MRVNGFDFLRGTCALMVALYHMLSWSGVAEFYSWGLFGVYVFFALSGASLVVAYRDRFARGMPASEFLLYRFVRLAPLFLMVLALSVHSTGEKNLLQTATLLFGLADPGSRSLVTGGWSIGVEFVFYLMFPLLLSLALCPARYWIGALLAVVQLVFVNEVIAGDLRSNWVAYTQPLAFIAYFYIGCLIGARALEGAGSTGGTALCVACVAGILIGTADSQAATLTGLRGVLLFILVLTSVHYSVGLRVPAWLAVFMGEISYGTYLMHPLIFEAAGRLGAPVYVTIPLTLAGSVIFAGGSYHFYERKVRAWVRRKMAQAPRLGGTEKSA